MTTRKEALTALRDKVRDGKHWHFDETSPPDDFPLIWIDAFNGSLDAALALFEAVLPGWGWTIQHEGLCYVHSDRGEHSGVSDKPSKSLLLAILEALIAEEGQ